MLRHLVIEERHGGIVRIANGSGTVDVTGRNLEEALLNAMTAAGVNSAYDVPSGSFETAEVFDTLLGKQDYAGLGTLEGVGG